jgi:hypothetical protein
MAAAEPGTFNGSALEVNINNSNNADLRPSRDRTVLVNN